MAEFPKTFVWGAATAAYQIEGGAAEDGKGRSIWDVFSHTPGRTYRGETGDVACDSYHRWREDVALLQSMHLKAYRFSVSWPRIAPNGDTDWNEKGLAYYDALVDALLEAGIEPYVTLYHWDLPQALEAKGGWRNIDTARAFAKYAAKMAEHFNGRVHQWFTFNEPACIVGMGYGTGEHAPGLKLPLEEQFVCWQNILYAHCMAAWELREEDSDNRVGIVSTGRICYPVSEARPVVSAARALTFACPDDDWVFTHTMTLDPLCLGHWPERKLCGPRLAACIAAVPRHLNNALLFGEPDKVRDILELARENGANSDELELLRARYIAIRAKSRKDLEKALSILETLEKKGWSLQSEMDEEEWAEIVYRKAQILTKLQEETQ